MAHISKRLKVYVQRSTAQRYILVRSIDLVKEIATAKFDES